MYRIQFLETALDDLKEIVTYISHTLQNPVAAENFTKDLLSQIDTLSEFPYLCPSYRPIKPLKQEYRRLHVKNYFVFYWVNEQQKEITIARVIYSRRNIQDLL